MCRMDERRIEKVHRRIACLAEDLSAQATATEVARLYLAEMTIVARMRLLRMKLSNNLTDQLRH